MLWFLPLAFATDDPAELDRIAGELASTEVLMTQARQWLPGQEADPEALRSDLIARAKQSLSWGRSLVAVRGRLNEEPKKFAELITRTDALELAITQQRQQRQLALAFLEIRTLTPTLTAESASAFRKIDDGFHKLHAKLPADSEPFDGLVAGPLAAALEHKKWTLVHGWATLCTVRCTDTKSATDALGELPERFHEDSRWSALETGHAAPKP